MKKEGFTLIELMAVVVIIGILAAIAIPNFVKTATKAKEASVKANMHTVQVTIEAMSIELSGNYPTVKGDKNIAGTIVHELPGNFGNPFNPIEKMIDAFEVNAGLTVDTTTKQISKMTPPHEAGRVSYSHNGEGTDDATLYVILGSGKDNRILDLTLFKGS